MLAGIVSTALSVCDRTEYSVPGSCPSCGGILSGYDTRKRRFAVLYEDDRETTIDVIIHRSYCRSCGRIAVPDDPFYPGTRMGSPVVDLCRSFAATMPCSRVSTRLAQMGVIVDRWTVRSYCRAPLPQPPVVPVFGMQVPVSIISLSSFAGMPDKAGRINGEEILAACRFPAQWRPAMPAVPAPPDR